MLSPEFSEKLSHFPNLKKYFQGVFSADTIPSKINNKSFLICNTDIKNGSGKHWYCVLKFAPSILECFDSLGIDDQKKTFFVLVRKTNKKLLFWRPKQISLSQHETIKKFNFTSETSLGGTRWTADRPT